eukprot:GHVL01010380.1.p1 GENE.GHVL01010380.1~~GHVL01010380.1.p1  ORF type:complete len:250 (+),score=49.05 GHVL01010380.1:52-750(+)
MKVFIDSMVACDPCGKKKDIFRGKIHLFFLFLAPWWCYRMIRWCFINENAYNKLLYVILSCICFFCNYFFSAIFHNITWDKKTYTLINKLDHIGIFMMIGGSATPMISCILPYRLLYLCIFIQWTCVFIGVYSIFSTKFSHSSSKTSRTYTYILMGLLNLVYLPYILEVLTYTELLYLLLLMFIYIIGALIYAYKSFNPIPGYFGAHEIFHVCCVVASIFTMLLNESLLKRQ